MVIYADVLLILNLIVNYLLLISVGALIHCRPPFYRLFLGALFGAFCSFIILLPPMNVIISFIIKAVVSLIMVLIAFPVKNGKMLIRYSAWFYGVTFAYCGIMTVLVSVISPRVLSINNMAVYIDISPLLLIIMTTLCYLAIKLFCAVAVKLRAKDSFYDVEITKGSKSIKCRALLDTGCGLKDVFSGNSVIIVEEQLALSLIPNRITVPDIGGDIYDGVGLTAQGMRLIPYSSVGARGMMQAFCVDKAVISQGKKQSVCENITVAMGKEKLTGDYCALIGEELASLLE